MIPVTPGESDAPQMTLEAPLPGAGAPPAADANAAAGGGEVVDPEALLGLDAAPKRAIPFGTLLIAGVAIAAGGMLYGMRQIGLGPRLSIAEGPTIKLPEVRGPKVDHQRLLEDLNAARTTHQVPSGQVKKNPFQLIGMALIPSTAYTGEEDSVRQMRENRERSAKERAEYERAVAEEFKKFELNAVLGGAQPVARINGTLYRLGEKVGKHYTLKAINSLKRSVDLECDGNVLTLTIPMQNDQ